MEKEKNILFNFTSYILLFIFICLIGLSNVSALENYENLGNLNSNTSFYVIYPGLDYPAEMVRNEEWNFADYNITSLLLNIDNYNFKKDNIYRLTLTLPKSIITNANSYSVVTSNGNTCSTSLIVDMDTNYPKFSFRCDVDTNSISLKIFNSTGSDIITNHWWFTWSNLELERLLNSDENLDNTIKDTFETCRDSYNLLNMPYTVDNKLTNTSERGDHYWETNYYVYLNAGETYTFSYESDFTSATVEIYLYKTYQVGEFFVADGDHKVITFTPLLSGNYYIRYDINNPGVTASFWNFQVVKGSVNKPFEPYGEQICKNKIDETNDKLNDLNQSLTDSSPTDMSGLSDSAGWLPAGPVDSILTLPLTMLNSLVSNLSNNSCQNLSIQLPFVNENLILPCVKSLYDKMGVTGTLFTSAGLIASAFILFNYLLNLYQWVDSTLTMRENTMPGYFDDNWGGGA